MSLSRERYRDYPQLPLTNPQIMPPYVASVALLLVLSASLGSAFLQVAPLHTSNNYFRQVLLAERATSTSPTGGYLSNLSPPPASPGLEVVVEIQKKQENEKFQRALLAAKLAYDAIAVATTATADEVVDVLADAPPPPAVITAKSDAEPKPILLVAPATEVDSVVISTPKPETQKSIITQTPISNKSSTEKVVKQTTEFTVPRELAIVPVNESTVQFTAGALGGAAGFIVGGPILGIVTASVFNYLSRKEEDKSSTASATTTSPKKIVDTASQTALLAYNYVAQFEKKNQIIDSIFKLLERITDKAKETDTPASEVLVSLEQTLGGIANKVEELNDDYDIVGGVGTVLDSVGDLVEISVDKVVELNKEYKFTDRAVDAVKVVVGKVAEKK